MKTPEQIKELKQIPIEGILSNREIYPTYKSGEWLMYCSPLREDHTASFGVNPKTNTFHDLGSGERGDVIQVVMELDKISFGDACKVLEGFASRREIDFEDKTIFSSTCNTSESTIQDFQITAVKDLQHPALIRYVESRKISFKTAYRYLREIHYTKPSGNFFGVGYQNEIGGYMVRNGVSKIPMNLGHTSFKIFTVPNSKNVAVFEGVFDLLSACEFYKGCPTMTTIILNSTSNLNQALPIINQYEKVFCYLDNDDAGFKALDKLRQAEINIFDCSHVYKPFNDFNEFLTNRQNAE